MAAQALANCRLYQKEALANASLRSILHEAPDAVVTTDLHGKINFASPSCERVIGWQAEQMLGRKAAELYRGPDGPDGQAAGGEPASGVTVARDIMARLQARRNHLQPAGRPRQRRRPAAGHLAVGQPAAQPGRRGDRHPRLPRRTWGRSKAKAGATATCSKASATARC